LVVTSRNWTAYDVFLLRFQEDNGEVLKLREKEKGDWKKLTLAEKKVLYRASFCQTIAEVLYLFVNYVFKNKCSFLRKDKTGNYSPIVALCSEANVWWKFFICTLLIMVFYNIIYFKMTSQYYIVFKSVVWKKGDESFRINAVLGLGVCRIEPRFSPESCVLPCAPLHIHLVH